MTTVRTVVISTLALLILTACEKHNGLKRQEAIVTLSKISNVDQNKVVSDACNDIAHNRKYLMAIQGYGIMVPGTSGDFLELSKSHTIFIVPGTSDHAGRKAAEIFNHVAAQYAEVYNMTQLANPSGCAKAPLRADGRPDAGRPAPDQSQSIGQ